MAKVFLALALVLGAHFAMTFNVPAKPGRGWIGWPFAAGDSGWFGRGPAVGRIPVGALLAAIAAGGYVLAVLSLFRIWVPAGWWPVLAAAAAVTSLLVMASFFTPNKCLAIAVDLTVVLVVATRWI